MNLSVMPHKLLVEGTDPDSLEFILEEKNKDAPQHLYIKGPYLMAEEWPSLYS
jgi:hypothetical protein